jgi:hypothetical protein
MTQDLTKFVNYIPLKSGFANSLCFDTTIEKFPLIRIVVTVRLHALANLINSNRYIRKVLHGIRPNVESKCFKHSIVYKTKLEYTPHIAIHIGARPHRSLGLWCLYIYISYTHSMT